MALTPKQKIFVDEYLIDLNATRAYKVAYPSIKSNGTAAQAGSRMLRNVKVDTYIQTRMKDRCERAEISQDKVLTELSKIGFADISDFATTDGKSVSIKPTAKIDKSKLGAIAGIKEGSSGIEIKLNDKLKALELIGRHLGMFKDKTEVNGDLGLKVLIDYGGADEGG